MNDRASDIVFQAHTARRIEHWNADAGRAASRRPTGRYYHRRLETVYAHIVSPGASVLELGCGNGDLLSSLRPSRGVGVDFSPRMLEEARKRHPDLEFICADVHDCPLTGTFDYIILSDLVNDVWDVQRVFEQMRGSCTPATRIVLNAYSHLWEGPLLLAARMGLARPMLPQNWLTRQDVGSLLALAGFEVVKSWRDTLLPLHLPMLAPLANRFLGRLWPLAYLCVTNVVVARPDPVRWTGPPPTVTVLVPARNEAGNVRDIIRRVPEMGGGTELLFVEGQSTDDTYAVIEREIASLPAGKAVLMRQPGKGKGDAVRAGFDRARGDILMILDADLTVPPEDLPRFFEAIVSGRGEFINGVRLVYPMQEKAMRFMNLLGNKFFSSAFSWLLGQPVKDTLCGTKVLRKRDYRRIAANRGYFGDFDPFGDFDLLFGAAKQNMRIIDLPIRYRERTYGDTNIRRWSHGMLLFRMLLFAARRIKFV